MVRSVTAAMPANARTTSSRNIPRPIAISVLRLSGPSAQQRRTGRKPRDQGPVPQRPCACLAGALLGPGNVSTLRSCVDPRRVDNTHEAEWQTAENGHDDGQHQIVVDLSRRRALEHVAAIGTIIVVVVRGAARGQNIAGAETLSADLASGNRRLDGIRDSGREIAPLRRARARVRTNGERVTLRACARRSQEGIHAKRGRVRARGFKMRPARRAVRYGFLHAAGAPSFFFLNHQTRAC